MRFFRFPLPPCVPLLTAEPREGLPPEEPDEDEDEEDAEEEELLLLRSLKRCSRCCSEMPVATSAHGRCHCRSRRSCRS